MGFCLWMSWLALHSRVCMCCSKPAEKEICADIQSDTGRVWSSIWSCQDCSLCPDLIHGLGLHMTYHAEQAEPMDISQIKRRCASCTPPFASGNRQHLEALDVASTGPQRGEVLLQLLLIVAVLGRAARLDLHTHASACEKWAVQMWHELIDSADMRHLSWGKLQQSILVALHGPHTHDKPCCSCAGQILQQASACML